ncbi:hypothetical protein [Bradyrhizobium sp. RDI18]|uniref:hypothetical protein n=1 Tax=Bradyrhizobium sp. RDI18 TaxID=3367400 RepID=UPI003712B007
MIKVSITQNGELLDEIEFDRSNLIDRAGAVAVIHRHVMEECPYDGLWHRVAHAARVVAERDDLLDALEAEESRQAAPDADAALSATSPDISPDRDDGTRGGPPAGWWRTTISTIWNAIRTRRTRSIRSAAGCSVATRAATSGCRGGGP